MPDQAELLIDCHNTLGEGPLWHPARQHLFWFDITGHKLFCAKSDGTMVNEWAFDEPVSAAAIIDDNNLLVASASALLQLNLENGARKIITPLEADNLDTRGNDGRVNHQGGFWIGTMRRDNGNDGGAVYQFRHGKLEKLFDGISIPNATCFSPDGKTAYWTDTRVGLIKTCALDTETGLPASDWTVLVDTQTQRGSPDGAVVDSEGYIWSARWGGGCVVRHAPDGSIDRIVEVPVSNVTCPSFGGADLKTLFVTTAREGLSEAQLQAEPHAGGIFSLRVDVAGLPEVPVAT